MNGVQKKFGSDSGSNTAFAVALLCGLAVGVQSLGKPVHIDDALYLHIARQILQHPLDPYSGPINWQQVTQPAYKVSISPPLMSYQFAAVTAIFADSEIALHVSMIPWAILASWGIYRLSERYCRLPLEATLAVMLAPAVVVGLNLMLDVPLLACIVTSLECGLRFSDHRRFRWAMASLLFGAAAVLVKFAGIVLAPLAIVVAIERRQWRPLIVAIGPAAAYFAWQQFSRAMYGTAQADQGLGFLERFKTDLPRMVGERTLTMFVLLGMTLSAWVSLLTLFGGKSVAAAKDLPTSKSGRWTLLAWMFGTAAFVILFGPFVAVRSFLPLCPPLVWLTVRAIEGRRRGRSLLRVSIALVVLLSGLLQWADWRWAAVYPEMVATIRAKYADKGKPILFVGHWGWQHYCEKAGFIPWEFNVTTPPVNALVLVPLRPDRQMVMPNVRPYFRTLETFEIPPHPLRLTTWNREHGIRFYGGDFGEIPWGFTNDVTDRIAVCEIVAEPAGQIDPLLFPPEKPHQPP